MATPAFDPSVLTRRGVLSAAASTLLLAACGQPGQRPDDGPASDAPDDHELVVGASLELTGRGAAVGVLQQRALEITADTLNVTGFPVGKLRRTVRLEIRDNGGNPAQAAKQATDLIQRTQAHALIGGTLAETSMAIIDVAEELRTPFLSLAAGDGIALPLAERTFVFKLTPDAAEVARRLARLLGTLEIRRVALLAADGLHGDSGVRAVRAALPRADVQLARTVRLPAGGQDFGAAAARAAAGKPAGVIVWGTAPDSGAAARELRRAGYRGPLFFDAGAVADDTLARPNAAAVEGAYVVHPACLSSSPLTAANSAEVARKDFTYRYLRRHASYTGFAPYASDGLQLLVSAARMATNVDRGRLRAFLQAQVVEGMAGAYAFTPTRHGGMEPDSLGIYQVHQGIWERYA
ncbi:ABC transporter substrate-binding protein [Micromonospora sp. NPDC049836]|uniref:ABC transporter substrate-binding protein n=1 Tax=Micromonospora sp. NPDC049836 TaxID=3364274 RepID=UPI0037B69700